MIRDKGVSGKPSTNGEPDNLLTSSPSANGDGKAHTNGSTRTAAGPAWKVRKAILAIPATVLSSAGKVLLSVVADHAGYGRSTCWATKETLAFESGVVERQVQRLLSGRTGSKTDLISMGWLTSTWETTRKGGDAYRDLALGPKTLEWIEQVPPRLDTRFRAQPCRDLGCPDGPPRDDHLVIPRGDHLVAPHIEHPQIEQSSSSSTPPPRAGDDDDFSLRSQESGGSEQKAKLIPDDEGLELVCAVAGELANLPGLVGKVRAATDLPLRCGHDWRFLAAVFVRLDAKVATREARPKDPVAYALGKMFKEMRSKKFPAAKLAALDAKVERLLAEGTKLAAEEEKFRATVREWWAKGLAQGDSPALIESKIRSSMVQRHDSAIRFLWAQDEILKLRRAS